MPNVDAQMQTYYLRGLEADRLDGPKGVVEYERTKEIVARALPETPARIADIGGGPGRYARWLVDLGHVIEHRDVIELHVEQLRAAGIAAINSQVGDARHLDLEDASVDAVLLFGPLYHLADRDDRVAALREANRIVRPGGVVLAAVISRWAARLDGLLLERLYEPFPHAVEVITTAEHDGNLPPLQPGGFCGYMHTPGELVSEIADSGLELVDLVGVEGMPMSADDLAIRLADPIGRQVLFDCARSLERVPDLLGLSPHLLATAKRPDA